jgi:hypothetical protein
MPIKVLCKRLFAEEAAAKNSVIRIIKVILKVKASAPATPKYANGDWNV